MAHKELKPDKSLEQIELERRVDQMMDLSQPDPPHASPAPTINSGKPIDIFSDAKTAPDVSPELLKQIGVEKTPPTPPNEEKKPAATAAETKVSTMVPAKNATKHKKSSSKAKSIDDTVDEIVRAESDELLALEDAAHKTRGTKVTIRNKTLWLLAILVVILLALLIYPAKLI